ncbi:MAG: acyloxyacyl hydrolase [Puniceicoccales bacterium]|nr:acyloxyacyl hydrolase [Puniceicoccales bacterium]
MNKKLFKIALSALAIEAGSLFAGDVASSFNPYVAVKGGFVKPGNRDNVKYKKGGTGAIEFGVSYDAWRLGLEVAYRQAKIKESTNLLVDASKDKFNALAGMVNVYYDYALTEEVALYVGAGLGVAKFSAHDKTTKVDTSKTVFAWQIVAGLGYDINENWTVEAGYRLFNTAKVKSATNSVKTPFCHSLEAGLRYNF